MNFKVPTTGRAILKGIGAGDRFVLALTRPAPEPTPTPTPVPTPEPTPSVTETVTEPVAPPVTETVTTPDAVPQSSGGSGQSRSEPAAGDLPGTSDTTGIVAFDQAARGRLTESAALWDTDWFAADLTAGRTYRIQVLGTPGVDCTLLAPIVESVQDASGTVVAGTEWWDESRELWSRLTFTPASDGRYYISVVGEANYGGVGTYILALTDGGSGSDERIAAIGSQGCVPEAPVGLGPERGDQRQRDAVLDGASAQRDQRLSDPAGG